MRRSILAYVEQHKDKFGGRVLEVGSLNVNGSIREVIDVEVGIDLQEGKDVDIVMAAETLLDHFGPEAFDTVISCETLEHIEYWREALEAMWCVLKVGGWFLLTAASLRDGFHGYPSDYWRFTRDMLRYMYPDHVDLMQFDSDKGSVGILTQKTRTPPNFDLVPVRISKEGLIV